MSTLVKISAGSKYIKYCVLLFVYIDFKPADTIFVSVAKSKLDYCIRSCMGFEWDCQLGLDHEAVEARPEGLLVQGVILVIVDLANKFSVHPQPRDQRLRVKSGLVTGTFAPKNFRSLELSLPRTKVLRTFTSTPIDFRSRHSSIVMIRRKYQ